METLEIKGLAKDSGDTLYIVTDHNEIVALQDVCEFLPNNFFTVPSVYIFEFDSMEFEKINKNGVRRLLKELGFKNYFEKSANIYNYYVEIGEFLNSYYPMFDSFYYYNLGARMASRYANMAKIHNRNKCNEELMAYFEKNYMEFLESLSEWFNQFPNDFFKFCPVSDIITINTMLIETWKNDEVLYNTYSAVQINNFCFHLRYKFQQ